jgi:hypothetical protein
LLLTFANAMKVSPVFRASTFVFVGLTFAQCSFFENEKKQIPDAPIHTLVFMDKTQSVNVNRAFVADKYKQVLNDLVEQNVRQKGDKLEVYFIHENTQKARAMSLTCRTEVENTDNMNATDREAAQTASDMLLQRERTIFLRQAVAKLGVQNVGSSQRYTDIWASLPVVAKAAEAGAEVKVYYLSDMIESMRGTGRRDFHSNPPKDNAEAEAWAKADAKTALKNYQLGGADVKIVLPFEPTSSTKENNPTVSAYWTALLQELGAVGVEEL